MGYTWTKRDRIEAVFNGEQPDRVPIYDILVNDSAVEFYSGKKLNDKNGYETVCEAISNSLDMTRDIIAPKVGDVIDERGYHWHYERWTVWITKYPFSNEEEIIKFVKEDIERLESWIPDEEYVKQFQVRANYTQNLIKDTVNIFICPNANVNYCFNMLGMENFCLLIYDEPELTRRWLKASGEADLKRIEALANYRQSPVSLIYCDIAQKGGLIFPPDFLKKELYPNLRNITELLHSKGIKVIFHSDGNIMSILDDLVEIGIDGLNPLEIAAGMDIKEIKERFGRKFVIAGGIDVSRLMPLGTRDEVIKATKELIKLAGKDYGLCLGSSTELGNDIPLENIKAMIETVWEYGKYPLNL